MTGTAETTAEGKRGRERVLDICTHNAYLPETDLDIHSLLHSSFQLLVLLLLLLSISHHSFGEKSSLSLVLLLTASSGDRFIIILSPEISHMDSPDWVSLSDVNDEGRGRDCWLITTVTSASKESRTASGTRIGTDPVHRTRCPNQLCVPRPVPYGSDGTHRTLLLQLAAK